MKNIKFAFKNAPEEIFEGTIEKDKSFWGDIRIDHDMSKYSIKMVNVIHPKTGFWTEEKTVEETETKI